MPTKPHPRPFPFPKQFDDTNRLEAINPEHRALIEKLGKSAGVEVSALSMVPLQIEHRCVVSTYIVFNHMRTASAPWLSN